jgi:hypothetical protein
MAMTRIAQHSSRLEAVQKILASAEGHGETLSNPLLSAVVFTLEETVRLLRSDHANNKFMIPDAWAKAESK